MNDLINKINSLSEDNKQELLNKYSSVLEFEKKQERMIILAYIYDIGYIHIKNNYSTLNIDFKTWSMLLLNYLFDYIKSDSDIINILNDFINYYNLNYKTYINNIGLSVSDYDTDIGFIKEYMMNTIVKN